MDAKARNGGIFLQRKRWSGGRQTTTSFDPLTLSELTIMEIKNDEVKIDNPTRIAKRANRKLRDQLSESSNSINKTKCFNELPIAIV